MDTAPILPPRPAVEPAPAAATPPGASRIDWLFRDALRHRHIHPLMEPLRRHREQRGAQ
jgi:hypothetical protein